MKKLLIVCANGVIAIWFFLLWCKMMLLSSDMPINITYDEMKSIVLTILVSTIITILYVKIIPGNNLYYLLLFPKLLWGFSMTQSLIYNYHEYDTIITITGFICSALIFLVLFLDEKRTSVSSKILS
ncbi:hypothetical protein [Brevibacillus parabrevis]|uniref:hypothetical protein n=1 Tax=Brevibacillus parabrevis TaxID=54914 RepID=UPI000B1ED12E|nr:hypothetical protein [Brevibacillus parabrevis]